MKNTRPAGYSKTPGCKARKNQRAKRIGKYVERWGLQRNAAAARFSTACEGEESQIAASAGQSKGKGGEAAVMAEADFRSERPVPQKDTGSAGAQPFFSDR